MFFLILRLFHDILAWILSNNLFFFWLCTSILWVSNRRSCKDELLWKFFWLWCYQAALLMLVYPLFSHRQSTSLTSINKTMFLSYRSESINSSQAFCFMSNYIFFSVGNIALFTCDVLHDFLAQKQNLKKKIIPKARNSLKAQQFIWDTEKKQLECFVFVFYCLAILD